jgi:carboxypeptidase Q
MPLRRRAAALVACILPFSGLAAEPFTSEQLAEARVLRERALDDDTAYDLLRSLTTEVGPRLAGSPGDARAVAWAVAQLDRLGFENVRAEPVTVPRWVRGEARAAITAPWPQPLVVTSVGGSVGTPPGGVEAEIVPVQSIAELDALPGGRVEGRIVYFNARMERSRDGHGYGPGSDVRWSGAAAAAKRGAAAMVMRPAGTSTSRTPHTGGLNHADGIPPIPALVLSNPDADLVDLQLASGRPVRLRLESTARWDGEAQSANVIGEIPGRSRRDEIVLLGAHLDSWDLGTGAHDDGAGVAIVTAAAKLIGAGQRRPARTIRVVLFANEEFGLSGAKAYAAKYADAIDRHVIGLESDSGAFEPYGYEASVEPGRLVTAQAMQPVLGPLGLEFHGTDTTGGADIGRLRDLGMPVLSVDTDWAPYFDLHHTANDTFDQVDPELLRRNVAAYAAIAFLAADAEGGFGRLPVKQPDPPKQP